VRLRLRMVSVQGPNYVSALGASKSYVLTRMPKLF
jgi:hypothetical protein